MYSPECLTVTFNLARLRESEKRYEEAMTRYAGILERYPEYTNCKGKLFSAQPKCLGWLYRFTAHANRPAQASAVHETRS